MKFLARCLISLLSVCAFNLAHANPDALIGDTQKTKTDSGNFKLVWWMPNEFFVESFSERKVAQKTLDEVIATVDGYAIFAVIDTKISTFGTVEAKKPEDIIATSYLLVNGDTKLQPLPEEEINEGLKTFFSVIKPLFANMMGNMGKSFQFLVFKNKLENGKTLLDATKPGNFTFYLSEAPFSWRLPLGSLLPPRFDAKTGEEFPGNYNFSPFSGDKLVLKPAAK